eukprot:scaffold13371_cov47-Attheya_sp.AAC.2
MGLIHYYGLSGSGHIQCCTVEFGAVGSNSYCLFFELTEIPRRLPGDDLDDDEIGCSLYDNMSLLTSRRKRKHTSAVVVETAQAGHRAVNDFLDVCGGTMIASCGEFDNVQSKASGRSVPIPNKLFFPSSFSVWRIVWTTS